MPSNGTTAGTAFADRLAAEWTHAHCLTDVHKPAGAQSQKDRYTLESAVADAEAEREG